MRVPLNTLFAKLMAEYPTEMTPNSDLSFRLIVNEQRKNDVPDYVCMIRLHLAHTTDECFTLDMFNVPFDEDVRRAGTALNGTWHDIKGDMMLSFTATSQDHLGIRNLATAIRDVIEIGKSYPDPNWKWSAPRTARSLERLARGLRRKSFTRD